ncbi:MAG: hypothetical protein WAX06_10670 [Lactococcus lactis]
MLNKWIKGTTQPEQKVETTTSTNPKGMPQTTTRLGGANPAEGTPGLQYNSDYTAVTGYNGTAII